VDTVTPARTETVRLTKVRKVFPHPKVPHDGRPRLRRQTDHAKDTVALRGVTVSFYSGEGTALLGLPGAGRSTLLHLITGVFRADGGQVLVRGRVSGLIASGAGFTGDWTLRENVVASSILLGEPRERARSQVDSILGFVGMGDRGDQRLRDLGPAETKKLGYSTALHSRPDIFVSDDELVVGGSELREASLARLAEVPASGRTLVVASNSAKLLPLLCTRGVVLEAGRIDFDGDLEGALAHYWELRDEHRGRHPRDDEDDGDDDTVRPGRDDDWG
jgi:ABC-2 type transport system ATP-binding protein